MSVNSVSSVTTDVMATNSNSLISKRTTELISKGLSEEELKDQQKDQQSVYATSQKEINSNKHGVDTKESAQFSDKQLTVDEDSQSLVKKNDPEQLIEDSLRKLTEASNQLTPLQNRRLEFVLSKHSSANTVVKVIDRDTDEMIRQIPSEEFIKMAEKINELTTEINEVQGLLFKSKV